ncbi:hypothetical protein [Streptomyces xantholiticus]|uniref:Uncharacterized protein n=1 Tax=Streptomyces xantholiticus TaxID=68285 RepID=A0ABV1V1M1_9ACTN
MTPHRRRFGRQLDGTAVEDARLRTALGMVKRDEVDAILFARSTRPRCTWPM